MLTRQLRIHGRVQGVGFRYALRIEARRLGVAGWVRNRSDGSVEALAQGAPAAVAALEAWARRGPPTAQVTTMQSQPPAPEFERRYDGFELLPSL